MKVVLRVRTSEIAPKVHKLVTSSATGTFAAEAARRHMEPYVPYREGALRASAVVSPFLVTYTAPYAHYQWEGVSKNGNGLVYRTGGTRSRWEEALGIEPARSEFAKEISDYFRRRA